MCRTACRRWRAGWSAIWATTWCARWSACRTRTRDVLGRAGRAAAAAHAVRDLRQRQRRADAGRAGLPAADVTVRRPPGTARRRAWRKRRRHSTGRCRIAAPPVTLPPLPGAGVQLHARGIHRRRCCERKEYVAAGDAFQVVPEPALLAAVRAAAVCAVSRAAADQSGAVPVLPRFRRLRGRRQQSGDPGAPARRHRDDPPACRHAPRGCDARGGPARWRPSCSPIRRSGRSI